jgi:hypothetical protein
MPEPMPRPGKTDVTESLIAHLRERQAQGIRTYGTSLQTFNGRRALVDLREELLDALQYVEQEILERQELEAETVPLMTRTYCWQWRQTSAPVGRPAPP